MSTVTKPEKPSERCSWVQSLNLRNTPLRQDPHSAKKTFKVYDCLECECSSTQKRMRFQTANVESIVTDHNLKVWGGQSELNDETWLQKKQRDQFNMIHNQMTPVYESFFKWIIQKDSQTQIRQSDYSFTKTRAVTELVHTQELIIHRMSAQSKH